MRNRQTLESEIGGCLRIVPQAIQLMDANLQRRGYERLLSIWPSHVDQTAVQRIADVFERHMQRNYAVDRVAGRLLVAPCCLEPLAQDLQPLPEPTCGVAIWRQPEQLRDGIVDLSERLDQIGADLLRRTTEL